ncbi:MAG: GAF domain-containing sensor histidine kinase [Chloroflexi bacterium]|nr:GAF domain-containing sensor histidine kinase [Chloroflexota bacterium]
MTDTEAASIMLVDSRTGQLRFEASTDPSADVMESIVVPVEGSIAGAIFSTGKPLMIDDVAADPRHFRGVDNKVTFITRSILGVPLVSKEKSIGVLQALNKKGGEAFTQEDLHFLEALAAQAAVAIVTARLFQQSDLIAEMVHEIRTPLAALSASTHLLLRNDLSADQREEMVRTIQSETSRLATMTTDFLDLARLESGRARFVRERFDLPRLVYECLQVVQPQADSRRVTMDVLLPGEWPAVFADRGKIKQVLLNLLTNAVKYNREGGTVHVSGLDAPDHVSITVVDSGRGIPPPALPHIFEKFYRVADSEGWTQGTGLGLAIAKRIVEAHGGAIFIGSTVNVGTAFTFTLPRGK